MAAAEPSAIAEVLKFLAQAVIVGLGWFVVHRLSAQRDRDKARRELVVKSTDSLDSQVDTLFAVAKRYHLVARDVSAELQLKMMLQDLATRTVALSALCDTEANLAPCRAEIGALRRAITGQHFEDEHLHALTDEHEQLQLIAEAVMRTKRAFTRLRHSQFPPP